MPQEIDVPGLGRLAFPDGMDDAAMSAAIKKALASTTPQAKAADIGAGLATGVVNTAAGVAGLPGDIQGLAEAGAGKLISGPRV